MFSFLKRLFSMSKSISVQQAVVLQNKGAVMVDVRELAEFQEVCAPGAINVPLSLIQKIGDAAYRNQGIDPNTEGLLVICRSGGRSAMACGQLGDNAINVEGGMLAWQAAGLPVNS
jgi:rhodanese-related sulfurtransferase